MGFLSASIRLFIILLAAAALMRPAQVHARAQGILFDAESTALFRSYADPVIRAAGLQPQNIDIFLQASDDINAFAVPGQIVLFSGLVLETETPEELTGIIAHEVAHIVGGHIPTIINQQAKAGLVSLASTIIGFGAILAGLGPLGAIVLAGGTSVGAYSTIGEIRVLEANADQAAVTYMDRAGLSSRGLISFFEREFAPNERALAKAYRIEPNPYIRTHPLSQERIKYLEDKVPLAKHYNVRSSRAKQLAHDMLRAKLFGFIKPPAATIEKYPISDQTLPARYARAVMFAYHDPNISKSLQAVQSLIADQPKNPYFHELKGYILTKAAQFNEAVRAYETAISLTPDNAIMRLEIGTVLVNTENKQLVQKGIIHLKIAAGRQGFSKYVYRHLARGYDALGQKGLAELATAEAFSHENNIQFAVKHAKRALKIIPKNDRVNRLRAQDILAVISPKTKDSLSQKKRRNRDE